MIGYSDGDRKTNGESAAALCPGTFHFNLAAVRFDQVPHDRQAQSESTLRPRGGTISLAEAIENVWQELLSYADACVCNLDRDLRVSTPGCDCDLSAFGRELDSVGEEIPEDLL